MARARLLAALLLTIVAAPGCSRRATQIEVNPKKIKIYGLDHPQRLTARLLDKKGRPLEIGSANWESGNPAIVIVDGAGLITPKSEGKTRVIAKYESIRSEIPVEVIDIKSVEITPTSVRLVGPAGVRLPVTATIKNSKDKVISLPTTWTSSKPEVATIDADGTVTSVGKGTTTLVAKVGEVQAVSEVSVEIKNLSRIELRPLTALVRVGDSQHFQVIAYDVDGRTIEGPAAQFTSSDPTVATVNSGGGAAGVKPGAAIVKATIGSLTTEATLIVN
jgi:uncharacterized protein YjdB